MRCRTTLVCAAVLLAASPGHAKERWEDPVVLGGDRGELLDEELRVASNQEDVAVAAWLETVAGANHVFASRYDSLGWSPAADVSGVPPSSAFDPAVAVGRDGRAAVAWSTQDAPQQIWVARWDGFAWAPPERVDDPQNDAVKWTPRVGVGPDGRVLVAWMADEIYARFFDGSAWQAPARLSTTQVSGLPGTWGDLAMHPGGGAWALWSQHDGETFRLASRHWNGSRWGEIREPDSPPDAEPGGQSRDARATILAHGEIHAVWLNDAGGDARVRAGSTDAGRLHWRTPFPIDWSGGGAASPRIASGVGVVVATFLDSVQSGGVFVRVNEGHSWGVLHQVPGTEGARKPSLAVDLTSEGFVGYHSGSRAWVVQHWKPDVFTRVFEEPELLPTGPARSTGFPVLASVHGRHMIAVYAATTDDGDRVLASIHRPRDVWSYHPWISKLKVKGRRSAGTTVILRGSDFGTGPGTISVGGAGAEPKKWKDHKVKFVLPAGHGPATLRLTRVDDYATSVTFDWDAPELRRVTPRKPRRPGQSVRLKGKAFGSGALDPECAVVFGDSVIPIGSPDLVSWKDGKIKVRVPEGEGVVEVRVRNSAGESEPVPFTYR